MKKINKIIIVGGGTSGYMTASLLLKTFPNLDLTLIEDENSGTIGVGESTTDVFNNFLNYLELDEKEWMKYSNATYKLSIDFTNFNGDNKRVKFPFGMINKNNNFNNELYTLKKNLLPKSSNSDYNKISCDWSEMLFKENIISDSWNNFNIKTDAAYQIEAHKFAEYLKNNFCIPKGLNRINAKIKNIKTNNYGIQSLIDENNNEYKSDLYIDCSGFKSILLEETLKIPFIKFDNLINDKAVATRMPYTDIVNEMETSTNATTLSSGWVWNIPLWNRIGTGYVYSSKFLEKNEAENEFKNYLIHHRNIKKEKEIIDGLEFKHIDIKVGKHQKAMHKNVIAIGLSYGFIEPLESTGLMLTYEQINILINMLSNPGFELTYNSIDRSILNESFDELIENWKRLIEYHFAFAKRDDTPYWKYVTEDLEYNLEKNIIELYKWKNPFLNQNILENLKFEQGTREIVLSTFKGNIISNYLLKNLNINGLTNEKVLSIIKNFENIIYKNKNKFEIDLKNQKFLTHYEYLLNNIYKE